MSIPASVTLYANWVHGTLSAGTYTQATPEKPNAHTHTYTGDESIAVDNDSPWNGQTCLFLIPGATTYGTVTLTSTEFPATQGRMLVEFAAPSDGYGRTIFSADAASYWEGRVTLVSSGGLNLVVEVMWDGQNVTVDLGSYTAGTATVVEIIWDTNNGTASQRVRARRWTLGGSPPSFTNTGTSSSAGTQDQQTTLTIGNSSTGYEIQFGRIIVSNDIAEDLSAVSEGGAAVYAFQ